MVMAACGWVGCVTVLTACGWVGRVTVLSAGGWVGSVTVLSASGGVERGYKASKLAPCPGKSLVRKLRN